MGEKADIVEQALKLIFSGSKAVNEAGVPVKVYHGTTHDLPVLKPGSYFTEDPSEGSAYTFWTDVANADKARGKYSIISAPEIAGKRLDYSGTIGDIEDPQAGQFYATDNGVVQYAGKGKWNVAHDVGVDEPSFDIGSYTMGVKPHDNSAMAQKMVDEYEEFLKRAYPGGVGGNVIPAYLNIKNPKELPPFEGNRFGERLGADPKWVADEIAKLKAQGYDSIVTTSDDPFYSQPGKTPPKHYITFEPTQVKSAVGNNGNYDFTDPRIDREAGGRIAKGPGGWLDDVVKMAGKAIAGEGEEAAKTGIRAYHGSPHRFNKFEWSPRTSRTGEGAQSYGAGLYFAENPAVAEEYRSRLAGRPEIQSLTIGNKRVGPFNSFDYSPKGTSAYENIQSSLIEDLLMKEDELAGSANDFRKHALDTLDQKIADYVKSWPEAVPDAMKLRKDIASGGASVRIGPRPGATYEVEIGANPEQMLHWDKLIIEQPETVRGLAGWTPDAVAEYNANMKEDTDNLLAALTGDTEYKPMKQMRPTGAVPADWTGGDLYQSSRLSGGKPHDPMLASGTLNEAGVPGIRYLDQGSRGTGNGTHNFVIYNDKLINIKNRYKDGGEVEDDIHDALRIARAEGGRAGYATDGSVDPQVFMTDANGVQYDTSGKVIQPTVGAEKSNSTAQPQSPPENINKMFNAAPQNYYSEVQPLIDYATTPVDRPGMASEPDLVDVMRVASQVAAEGQPQPDARGEGNLARRREEYINSLYGADKQGASSAAQNAAWIANRAVDVSPWAVGEVLHDIPYDAGATGDYQTAAAEGGLNALLTAPGMSAVGAVARPIVKVVRAAPKVAAGLAGVGAATLGSDEAEAGPARWFSKAMEVAGALPMEKMTGQQALAMLKKAVSPEELRWTGTEKFLNSRPQVSKGELLEHLKNNRMQVNEIRLGGEKPKTINYLDEVDQDILDKYEPQFKAAEAAHKEALEKFYPTLGGQDEETAWNAVKEAKRAENDLKLAAMQEMRDRLGTYRPTKYEGYSTPGGEGYTETLYTLGGNKKPKVEQRNRMFYLVDENGNTLRNQSGGEYSYYTESDANRAAASIHRESGRYKSSHWDDPDVLAHSRSQTLVYDPPGANRPYRVHNVDETQSDWGQDARKRGIYDHEARQKWEFDLNTTQNDLRKTTQAIRDRALELELTTDLGQAPRTATQAEYNAYHTRRQNLIDNDPEILALREKANNLTNRRNLLEESAPPASGVPSAPYVGSTEGWTDLAIKKQLDKALDSNADYFSWSPGEVHAERYDLSKHIGKVQYNPDDGSLLAYNPQGKMVVNESVNDPSDLDEYLGKELADKMRAEADSRRSAIDEYEIGKDEDTGEWTAYLYGEPVGETFPSKGHVKDYLNEMMANEFASNPVELSGLDLKVGGEGMRGYYDKVYLKRVQDVIKKATGEKPVIEEIEVQTADGPRKQLGIRLTDQMREKARFSDFNRGGVVQKALALTSKM